MNKKRIISFLLVIIWMITIFLLSSMSSDESNSKSKNTINSMINNTLEVTNGIGVTDTHPTDERKEQVIEKINLPFRKLAHASVYFILAILIINFLGTFNLKLNKIILITLIICFLYAITDEFHQTFVNGRNGQFSDVMIDTIGAVIGSIIYQLTIIFYTKLHKIKKI